ncbi:MAG: saccharopine dehydrogenase NADP-binding domain-containing protein [Sphingomonadales bacterium]
MEAQTIYLMGAYGYTAKLIAKALCGAQISFIPVGRDAQKLAAFCDKMQLEPNFIVADVLSATDLQFIQSKDIVINCAGPFNQFAPTLIAVCVERGAHYIDLTGEQAIVHDSYLLYKQSARQNQMCLLHSMAFESALADLLLSCALSNLKEAEIESVNSYYWLGSQQMSPGTKLTMKLANYASNFMIDNNQLVPFTQQKAAPLVGIPFESARIVPYPEVIFAFERCKPQTGASHFLLEANSNMAFAGSMLKAKYQDAPSQIQDIITRFKQILHEGPNEAERAQQSFELYVSVSSKNQQYIGHLKGHDMYQITAALVLLAVQKLSSELHQFGVLSPGEFLGQNGINWLSQNPFFQFKQVQTINAS